MSDLLEVYGGREPYIFVSYAHKDLEVVGPIIQKLAHQGFRVWYDAGIEAGTEWPRYIAERLQGSGCVLVFLSPNSVDSTNCRQEINFALSKQKDMLCVHLEDMDLPLGLEMQLGLSQAMFYQRSPSLDVFMASLMKAEILKPCRGEAEVKAPVETAVAAGGSEPASEEVDAETESPERKKAFTVTGDITYTLYGEEYTENQSDMMLRFFAQVLKRHQDMVDKLPECSGMNCVSHIDYTKKEYASGEMPSYFRVCRYFQYDNGSAICVGTAYAIKDKLKKMTRLLEIVGEDPSVFRSAQVELPAPRRSGGGEAPAAGGRQKKEAKNFL